MRSRRKSRSIRASALAAAIGVVAAIACQGSGPFLKEPSWPTPKRGAVVSEHPLATAVGIEILQRGGNAADAAIATALALAVVYPQAGNLGGGGFAIFVPHKGEMHAIDFRETAPAAATPAIYLDSSGAPVPARSLAGPLAVAVPGSPAGLHELYRQCGTRTMPFAELARPAIALAQSGFRVDAWLAKELASKTVADRMNDDARAIFYPGGDALREGALCRQPELAQTLALFANQGPRGFYSGPVAEAIVRAVDHATVPNGAGDPADAPMRTGRGWIKPTDLADYKVHERKPLIGWFRGMEIITMPPPSSGGIIVLQVLGILEGMPLDAERTLATAAHALEREKTGRTPIDDPGLGERMVHWWVEAERRAFADRAAHMGDPDFYSVPVERLLSPEWIAERRISIGESADLGIGALPPPLREGGQTTHLSVIDAHGNAVSLTTTLNTSFGSGIYVKGGGFFLNSEMDDFSVGRDSPNIYGLVGGAANSIAPGKRPLSSMTPAVVRLGGQATTMVLGSPGGPRIVSAVTEILLRTLVLGQSIEDAVRAPRVHQQWSPKATVFERGFDPAIVHALESRRGHAIEWAKEPFGSVQALWLAKPGEEPVGVSDPRAGGASAVQGRPMSTPSRPPLPK